MNVLALTHRRITSAQSGYDLRVFNLCAQLPGERHLMVVPLEQHDGRERTYDAASIFASISEVDPLLGEQSRLRHLRRSDDHYLRRSQPAAFRAAVEQIRTVIRDKKIDLVVVFGGVLAEFAPALADCDVVLDVCDSRSLTERRELVGAAAPTSRRQRWKKQVDLWRVEATESRLPDRFDRVVTISEPDRAELLRLHGPADNVHVVPNGVDKQLLEPLPRPGTRRGVAFWGNLAFGPNQEALRFFVHRIYVPFLVSHDIELYVVGHSPPDWLTRAAEGLPGIVVAGFQEDLPAAVRPYPIMVNAMRTGSGLKNKVLEAFGFGLVVVSTALGVDALPDVRDGEHLALADDPSDFGRRVLELLDDDVARDRLRARAHELLTARYGWERVGREWRHVLRVPDPEPVSGPPAAG